MQELEKILEEATRQEDAPICCGDMEADQALMMETILNAARKKGWEIEEKGEKIKLAWGHGFSFEVPKTEHAEVFSDAVRAHQREIDLSAETYSRLDATGHGKDGKELLEVYREVKAFKDALWELGDAMLEIQDRRMQVMQNLKEVRALALETLREAAGVSLTETEQAALELLEAFTITIKTEKGCAEFRHGKSL